MVVADYRLPDQVRPNEPSSGGQGEVFETLSIDTDFMNAPMQPNYGNEYALGEFIDIGQPSNDLLQVGRKTEEAWAEVEQYAVYEMQGRPFRRTDSRDF